MDKYCWSCNTPLGNVWIDSRQGPMHPQCFHMTYPPKYKDTFRAVLTTMDDPVLVRQLLEEYVPSFIQKFIIAAFNAEIQRRYQASLESYENT